MSPSDGCEEVGSSRTSAEPTRHGPFDELYEALHERMGHFSSPPGRVDTLARRHSKLQVLTAWNDDTTTSRDDVLDLLDRAVSRTLVGACR